MKLIDLSGVNCFTDDDGVSSYCGSGAGEIRAYGTPRGSISILPPEVIDGEGDSTEAGSCDSNGSGKANGLSSEYEKQYYGVSLSRFEFFNKK